MQTVSGRVRVRVVPLGGVYTVAPAPLMDEPSAVHDDASSLRAPRNDGRILRRIERKRTTTRA